MRIDLYGKDTIDHVVNAQYVQSNSLKPELKKLVLLNIRPSAEVRYAPLSWNSPTGGGTYEGRIIVTQLSDQSVVAFSITSDQRPREATVVSADAADRQEMIAAYAMPLRDADRTFTRSQIEHALGRAGYALGSSRRGRERRRGHVPSGRGGRRVRACLALSGPRRATTRRSRRDRARLGRSSDVFADQRARHRQRCRSCGRTRRDASLPDARRTRRPPVATSLTEMSRR